MAAALVTIETGIKHKKRVSHKWNMKFRSKSSNRENGPTLLDFPLFPGIFQWDEQTECFPFSTEPKFLKILTKWRAPLSSPLFQKKRLELFLVFPQKLELRQFGQLHFYWNCVAVWSLLLWDHELIAQTASHQSNCESWLLWGLPREGAGGRGGSRIFFRRGCTRLLLYFNTNKPHSFFFAEYQLY